MRFEAKQMEWVVTDCVDSHPLLSDWKETDWKFSLGVLQRE